ncbi:hypothetical protein HNV10_05525 [Winogradskyella litoriviva]|uniref:GLPGLI family protein n=1 Tax=Winogradskyella litoriviva TaxID=1220182 RepID=A0ABX2E363_9FLAO|nr:hypothetical protein [Winogradskyella litoriviva]NRD22689.1 hypothetical protein [Winogradskyella litoriviva]
MKQILSLTMVLLPLILISQNSESYFPVEIGKEKQLTWYNDTYVESFTDSTELGGETYYVYSQKFKNNTIEMPIRISNDTVYHWNEVKNKHQVFFGINPKVGETIGIGTIKKIDAKLKTPKGKLTDLLVIEMTYSNGVTDKRYYKKGVGLVAVKSKKGLICYYVPE